jgi:DNA-binding NarL/FixJ family response regulator
MPRAGHLSECEREVCADRAEGLSYKDIATKRSLSISTVKTHLDRAFKKLRIHSSLELQCRLQGRKCEECVTPIATRMNSLAEKCAHFNTLLQNWKLP